MIAMGERASRTALESGALKPNGDAYGATWSGGRIHAENVGGVSKSIGTNAGVLSASASIGAVILKNSGAAALNYGVNGREPSLGFTSSYHTGGANVGFGDASVHFLSDDLAFDALVSLSVMADGKVVGDF